MKSAREWFRFHNSTSDPTVAEIHIIDFIGSWDDDWFARNWGYEMGVTARAFVEELAKLPESVKAIHLHINSPGGDIQAGINITNALREQQASKGRSVETFIDGIAASIASVIAMAGSKVHIGDNALVMIHNPWGLAIGSAAEMRKTAEVLDTMRGQIIATYQWHSALEKDALATLMDAETWMDADEAIKNGFATDKVAGLKAAASITREAAAKLSVPERFKNRVNAFLKPADDEKPSATQAADVVRACADAGLDISFANVLIASKADMTSVQARIDAEKAARAAAKTRSDEIAALCTLAKLPELAEGYAAGGMSIEAVRHHLTTIKAKVSQGEIDAGLNPDDGQPNVAAGWKNAMTRAQRRFGVRH